MPLPKPNPSESNTDFLDRCMSHETMIGEYPNEDQRYAVCNNLLKDKKQVKKNEQKLAREWVKQLKIAEKNNYPLVYKFYIDNYNKGIELFIETDDPNNPDILALFKEEDLKKMYSTMYIQTGLRFYKWYKRNLGRFIKEDSNEEDDVVSQNMERVATNRENYLAAGKEVVSVTGVARSELQKILQFHLMDPEFMAMGTEKRTTILRKEFQFKSRWMARRVVRTESTTAANAGMLESANEIFGDAYEKRWIATLDARGRSFHKDMNGVTIPKDEAFAVYHKGVKSELMFPGDISMGASAAQIVNCRCACFPVSKKEEVERLEREVRKT